MAKKVRTPAGHKKVTLTCQDRIYLLEALPSRESQVTLRLMRKLRERISLSEAEIRQIDFKQSKDGRVSAWQKPGPSRGFTFSPFELETIKGGLKTMDQQKNMADGHLKLWDAFVGTNEE